MLKFDLISRQDIFLDFYTIYTLWNCWKLQQFDEFLVFTGKCLLGTLSANRRCWICETGNA